jgi:hypothetical protein
LVELDSKNDTVRKIETGKILEWVILDAVSGQSSERPPLNYVYPRGLAGNQIPMGARIFAVADTLDAMTSNRPYRNAVSFQDAREEIVRCSGSQFDPDVVQAFLSIPEDAWQRMRIETSLLSFVGIGKRQNC